MKLKKRFLSLCAILALCGIIFCACAKKDTPPENDTTAEVTTVAPGNSETTDDGKKDPPAKDPEKDTEKEPGKEDPGKEDPPKVDDNQPDAEYTKRY